MSGEKTLIDYLNSARTFLSDKGFENARGNAEALLSKALQLPRIELYIQHDRPLKEAEIQAYRDLLRRRLKHEPLQLILGEVEFFGVSLDVRTGLLVPRPETEELVEKVVDMIRIEPRCDTIRLLDIGCGTGCISVALTACMPHILADAVDIDFDALTCTAANAAKHDVASRVRTIRADLFDPQFAAKVDPPYDLVISNPPYVTDEEYNSLQPEVKLFESRTALVGGTDGLRYYARIAELLPTLLKPNGIIAVEVGRGQATAVNNLFESTVGPCQTYSDTAGIDRIVIGKRAPS